MVDPGMKSMMRDKLSSAMNGQTKESTDSKDKSINNVKLVDGKILASFSIDSDGPNYNKPDQRVFDSFGQFSEEAEKFLGVTDTNEQASETTE